MIKPVFVPLRGDALSIADEITRIFRRGVGKRRGDILREVKNLEDKSPMDYRFIRGLNTLLLRRCTFDIKAEIDPIIARRTVFKESGLNPPLTYLDRERVLELASKKLGITVEELEESLWADSEDELVLKDFNRVSAQYLLKEYNTSLAQTLLFKAKNMTVQLDGDPRTLLWMAKRFGLMYWAERVNERIYIGFEGPASILKMTDRYGTAMAKVLPYILKARKWEIRAEIILKSWNRGRYSPGIFEFLLDDKIKNLFHQSETMPPQNFDSSVEERLYKDFIALRSEWSIVREPGPLVADGRLFFPDFLLKKNGIKVYLEIVGFWTEEYLKRKLSKLKELEEVNLIVAVNRNLACSNFKEILGLDHPVIFYEKRVPIKDVLLILKRVDERKVRDELRKLEREKIVLHGDVIDLEVLAKKKGVSIEAITRALSNEKGYITLGRELVSHSKLNHLRRKLNTLPREMMFDDVSAIIAEEGLKNATEVLKHLGYELIWESLDMKNLKVVRKE